MDNATLHQAMLRGDFYPGETGPVSFKETHISSLYFTRDHVYKIKKPVDFGFLDFTTLDQRYISCREEVRLNRRLCPDTYLGILAIRRQATGQYSLDPQVTGEIVDYAVRMKRLPEQRMLDALIATNDPTLPGHMERLGRHLARWHLAQAGTATATGDSDLERIRRNWDENLRQTAPFGEPLLSEEAQRLMSDRTRHFIHDQATLFERREAMGQVIDGHGDLHAEHICLTEPIRIYDCIEFNTRFRLADRLADLAFLLMDLDYRARRDLAANLLEAYSDTCGSDPDASLLLPFYKSYRAWVRGKVLGFLWRDRTVGEQARLLAAEQSRRYFNLALGYLCPQVLILTCGLMGSGKSAVAGELARTLGAVWLRSDVLRKELAGLDPHDRHHSAFGEGLYSREASDTTYRALAETTARHLANGRSVIVDASFARVGQREAFRLLTREARVPLTIIWMTCPEAVLRERLRQRRDDPSDGRPELLAAQKNHFQPPDRETHVLPVDTEREVAYNVQRIVCHLAERKSTREPS